MTLAHDLPAGLAGAQLLDAMNTGTAALLQRPRHGLHVSDLIDPRMPMWSIATKRRLLTGLYMEDKWLDCFRAAGILVWPTWCAGVVETSSGPVEVGCYDRTPWVHWVRGETGSYPVYYTPDAIVVVGGEERVVELKSVGTEMWKRVRAHGPLRKHVTRTKLYMIWGQKDRVPGYIIYENRDTLDVQVYPIVVEPGDEERLQGLVRYMAESEDVSEDAEDER